MTLWLFRLFSGCISHTTRLQPQFSTSPNSWRQHRQSLERIQHKLSSCHPGNYKTGSQVCLSELFTSHFVSAELTTLFRRLREGKTSSLSVCTSLTEALWLQFCLHPSKCERLGSKSVYMSTVPGSYSQKRKKKYWKLKAALNACNVHVQGAFT